VSLGLNAEHSPESVAAPPVTSGTGDDAEQIGAPTEPARPTRHPIPPEVLESCAGALAGMGGPTARSIAVTSCHRGEGRSTVAMALGLLERTTYHRNTLLVELDFERPSLAAALGLPDSPGVADVLRDEIAVESALRWTDEDLAVLSASDARGAPEALLAQVAAGDLLDGLSELFDTVIVDLPPLEGTGSAALVAHRCSTPLLVVRAGAAERRDIEKAVAMFDVPPPVLMNGVSPRRTHTTRRRSR
jgi:Mrp family chromosome partitioning ATPase